MAAGQKNPATLFFRNGAFNTGRNIANGRFKRDSLQPVHYQKSYYVLLQFDKLPPAGSRKELEGLGIRLFDYVPGHSFLSEIPDNFSVADLKKYNIGGIYGMPVSFKISTGLSAHLDRHASNTDNLVAVGFFGRISKEEVADKLAEAGAHVVQTKIQPAHTLFIEAGPLAIQKIAELPFVSFLSEQPIKPYLLNNNNRAAHALDALSAPAGRNLQGRNVTLGIGDNSDPFSHIDFTGRLIDRAPIAVSTHGTHTTGTMAGGGILNPRYTGMAPKASIVSQNFTDILTNAPVYVADYDMVLTNNSYTDADAGCPGEGEYDALSNYLDAQLNEYPNLLHNFASGNDGGTTCSPYPTSFATVKSGLQCAKDVLTIGNLDNLDYSYYTINNSSSLGPVADGRIKPEIVAGGTSICSTYPYNRYGYETGTSMASPTVTGTLGLLYERYRQLHGGADPTAALIKAVACNSAIDVGNAGPDYTYGFGMLNARSAVETLEKNQYFTGSVNQSGTVNYTITGIPAGTQQLKIMLYWPDVPAAPFVATTLVNNLDLTVVSPDASTHHPMILNPNPANVNDPAAEGVDNTNNIEQVVVNNPPAGNYTITVTGTEIPLGPQNYAIAYQVINPSVTVEYPFGAETLVPGETEYIRWTAFGGDVNTFTVEYSTDNGASWNTLSNTVSAVSRIYPWVVPATATSQALVRVTRNGTLYSDVSDYDFTILGQPAITLSNPCQGYAQLSWGAIAGATSYDIMMLRGDSMQAVANTASNSYLLGNLNRDSSYWLAVRAVDNTVPGRRSLAANIVPAGGACSLSALDKDLTIDSLVTPVSGRQFTSTQITAATPISVELKNLGTIPTAGSYNISYQVNGGSIVTETSAAPIPAGTALVYTFTTPHDFSAPGRYAIRTWVDYSGDPQLSNDTLNSLVKQLQNAPLNLVPAFTEGFESAIPGTYTAAVTGLDSLDRADFDCSDANGRMRTYIDEGFARTGNRCATLDQSHLSASSTADSLTLTFNLSNYSASDQIWLDFYYQNQGIDFVLPGNQVWVRGNDQAAWIPVYTLPDNPADFSVYRAAPSIDITQTLAAASPAQSVSSSFQVRFGEQGFTSTNSVVPDGDLDDGYSFDDVTITKAANDLAMQAILQPNLTNICNLSNSETVSVQVKNYSHGAISNVPVFYSINGAVVSETIPAVPADTVITYTFTHKADLSAFQPDTLDAWVNYSGDTYHKNDSIVNIAFQPTPYINTYPYLEGFESSNGGWYTGGINSSWQWGTPAKTVINKAANGAKAWVTSLTGDYNNNELSYLYSPCFDLSSLTTPVLSFSHIFQTEDDCDCDYHWAEYSVDGVTWLRLGVVGSGTNWYDDAAKEAWQQSSTRWHVSSYDIPTTGTKVRFRIVMSSDPGTTYEGVGIDDIHIFDKVPVYTGPNITSGLSQPVSGNGWFNFDMGGGRVASINPNGQDLGNTSVSLFLNTGAVTDTFSQYYLNRNIVIQAANPPADSVSVRLYFLDTEAQSLISASGCSNCTPLYDAYEAGATQYNSPVATEENGSLRDNQSGNWHFITPRQGIHIIPYDQGYYAEFQLGSSAECWINSGNPGAGSPLDLLSFTATKTGTNGLLQWMANQETGTGRYVVEKSTDGTNFSALDSVNAMGYTTQTAGYQYTDNNLIDGTNYYRLRIVATGGHYTYSYIRTITDTLTNLRISVFPNPLHTGPLYINTSVNCNRIALYDAEGRVLSAVSTSGLQHTLNPGSLAKGVYFLSVGTDGGNRVIKIIVE